MSTTNGEFEIAVECESTRYVELINLLVTTSQSNLKKVRLAACFGITLFWHIIIYYSMDY